MTTAYPVALDAFGNPLASDPLSAPPHHAQHADANDAIEAIEAKIGIGAGTPAAGTVLAGSAPGVSGWAVHDGTGDPHAQYQKGSEKGVANGYAALDSGILVPRAQLGTGTPSSAVFLRGDGTWAAPPAGSTVTPGSLTTASAPGDATAHGASDDYSRTDHRHGREADPIPAHVAAADPHPGYATDGDLSTHAAAADPHTGYLQEAVVSGFAVPAVVLGTAGAAGSGTTGIRSNATIAAFDATTPDALTFGQAGAVGAAAFAARRDHAHAMPADPVTAHVAAGDPHTGYQLESGRNAANGYAALDAGRYAVANGIQFPASPVASADVNNLDFYEEGTWSPTLTCATPGNLSAFYTVGFRIGRYVRIGSIVHWWVRLQTNGWTWSTASGLIKITALPFTPTTAQANMGWIGPMGVKMTTAATSDLAGWLSYVVGGDGSIYVMRCINTTNQAPVLANISVFATGTLPEVWASGSYEAA